MKIFIKSRVRHLFGALLVGIFAALIVGSLLWFFGAFLFKLMPYSYGEIYRWTYFVLVSIDLIGWLYLTAKFLFESVRFTKKWEISFGKFAEAYFKLDMKNAIKTEYVDTPYTEWSKEEFEKWFAVRSFSTALAKPLLKILRG